MSFRRVAKFCVRKSSSINFDNRSFKSSVRTAIRSFEAAFSAKDKDKMQAAINAVYSLMDRGVKQGVYKKNKAARTKQRITKLQKTA